MTRVANSIARTRLGMRAAASANQNCRGAADAERTLIFDVAGQDEGDGGPGGSLRVEPAFGSGGLERSHEHYESAGDGERGR
jgi:hypothetical protein